MLSIGLMGGMMGETTGYSQDGPGYQSCLTEVIRTPLLEKLQDTRSAILSSPAGSKMMKALGISSSQEFTKFLSKPENAQFKKDFEDRENLILKQLDQLHAMDEAKATSPSDRKVHDDQLIEILSDRYFTLNKGGFNDSENIFPPLEKESTVEKLLSEKDKEEDKALLPEASQDEKKSVADETKGLFTRMKECLANQPPQKKLFSARVVRDAMIQLGVSETITAGSAIAVQGIDHLLVRDLAANMVTTAISAGFGTVLADSGGSFAVRYFKTLGSAEVLNLGQLGIYEIIPTKKKTPAPGASPSSTPAARPEDKPHPIKYAVMNGIYVVGEAVVWIGLNDFINGLDCLYSDHKGMLLLNTGLRAAYSIGNNLLYFEVDKKVMNPQPASSPKK